MRSLTSANLYATLAERHLDAASVLLNAGHHDSAIFHSFHAFECICRSGLINYRRTISQAPGGHKTNIEHFLKVSRSRGFPFTRGAAQVAALVLPLRNLALYPDSGILPLTRFQPRNAIAIWSRVRGLVLSIRSALGV